jgi:NTE family protein
MSKKALVLGGGGVVGIAWESGIIAGMKAAGVDISLADIIVGTSAGSIIGSQLCSGRDFDQAETPGTQLVEQLEQLNQALDPKLLAKTFALWTSTNTITAPLAAQIGQLAKQACGWTEQDWLHNSQTMHRVNDWSHRDLRIISVDCDSGKICIHRRHTSNLQQAIAASCAIPGVFPTVTIDNSTHMDGGVISGTNAQVLLEDKPNYVLILAPITTATSPLGPTADKSLQEEVVALENNGSRVFSITANADDALIFGPNLMDPDKVQSSWELGFSRGKSLVDDDEFTW